MMAKISFLVFSLSLPSIPACWGLLEGFTWKSEFPFLRERRNWLLLHRPVLLELLPGTMLREDRKVEGLRSNRRGCHGAEPPEGDTCWRDTVTFSTGPTPVLGWVLGMTGTLTMVCTIGFDMTPPGSMTKTDRGSEQRSFCKWITEAPHSHIGGWGLWRPENDWDWVSCQL